MEYKSPGGIEFKQRPCRLLQRPGSSKSRAKQDECAGPAGRMQFESVFYSLKNMFSDLNCLTNIYLEKVLLKTSKLDHDNIQSISK